jgi:hypothetical protein
MGGDITIKGGTNAPGIGAGSGSDGTYYSCCGTVTIGGTVYWDGTSFQNGGENYLKAPSVEYHGN